MANVLTKAAELAKGAINSLVEGTHKLLGREDVDSQVSISDIEGYEDPTDAYTWKDKALVDLVNKRYEEARLGRHRHNEDIFTGIAFFKGKQNVTWNADGGGGEGSLDEINPKFSKLTERFKYKQENVIAVLIERMVARITGSYPSAWVVQLSDSPFDKAAARVGRYVTGHCNRIIDLVQMIEDSVHDFLISSTVFIEAGWDAKAVVDIGIPQADGSVAYHKAPIGDFCANLLLSIDAYPDPNAGLSRKGIDKGAYFIKRCLLPVSEIESKWGIAVPATAPDSTYAWLQQRIEMIGDDWGRTASTLAHAAEVTQMWERPSPQYTQGRFIVTSGNLILHKGVWPYEKNDGYPFIPLYYRRNLGSVWNLNAVRDLKDDQMSLNRLITAMAGIAEWWKPVCMLPDTSDIAPDDLIDPEYGKVIPYNAALGHVPTWTFPPGTPDFMFKEEQRLRASMEYTAGVRDFNADTAPPINSGKEYELRLAEDKSRLGMCTRRVGRAVAKLMEWELALMGQFGGSFDRMLGLSDESIPASEGQGQSAAVLIDVKALRTGQCRVVMQQGSGESLLPAARDEQLTEIIQIINGLNPLVAEFYLNQLSYIRSDDQVDKLLLGLKEVQVQQNASKPNPVLQQQMQQENEQQQLAMKLKGEQQAATVQEGIDQVQAAIEVHSQTYIQASQAKLDAQLEDQRFRNALQLQTAKTATPAVSLAGKLDPVEVASAAKLAGLDVGTDDQINQQMKAVAAKASPTASTGKATKKSK